MALEGNLRDFNILEVIQLLGQQGKTGVLRVWGKKAEEAGIFFSAGVITHATSSQREEGDFMGERLVKTGIISREDFEAALRKQKESARYLGEILLEEGMADEQAILNALYTQIHDIIYEVFRWGEGKFKFEILSVPQFPKVSVKLGAEEVMLNILKMVDEWPEIERRVPSPYMVLQQTGILEEQEIGLPEDHDVVYRLVDGNRSVQDIVELSLLGKFATLEALADLLEGGYIKTVDIKMPHVPAKLRPGLEALKQRPAYLAYGLGVIIALVLLIISFSQFNLGFLWRDLQAVEYLPKGYVEKVRQERVEWARKIFFLERGRYPGDPGELVAAGILAEDDLKGKDVR
ncbi:MAG: DUF4388 domain-containing protein [Deltaproteobacteria bacterium]|nr:DUF4388 domain-containing protein [Deltaproteobacteria bacterium]